MDVPVVILCGGLGSRMREETEYRPKPMLEIGGQPILWHIMKIYAHAGLKDFVLCLGYKGHMIKDFFLHYRTTLCDFTVRLDAPDDVCFHVPEEAIEDWRVTCADTGLYTQTASRVRRVLKYIRGDTFCLTYGDGVCDVDIGELLEFHRSHGKIATLTAVVPTGRFGELDIERDRVVHFHEKPKTATSLINGGFFVFEREGLEEYLGSGDDVVLEHEPMRRLARDGELVAFRHRRFWQCMDTYREWKLLNDLWESGEAPWAVWSEKVAAR